MSKPNQTQPPGLSDRQSLVVDLLLQGATHSDAAAEVGVARTTVTSWANHNVHFIVEHNLRRTDRLKASADCLHALVLKALLLVESEIDGGEVGSALALLKLVGVDHLSTAGMPGACSLLGAEVELAKKVESEQFEQMILGPRAQDEVRRRSGALSD